ncbi:hypothetical protein BSL78_12820 [Apostichopus japonicus]|uniref:Uncharacterized protein n=2 Tax=Stichopus japonicus TaxID=307972 RepID=A0A2G8KQT7_STIJA|nr:hypothetical protein BSL78_12820 [Apostichopus japonicus]
MLRQRSFLLFYPGPLGFWIAVNESSTLGYTVIDGTDLDEGEVTLDLGDTTLGGVGFYGDFLLLSVPGGNGTNHTIHYGTLSDDLNFTYVGKLSPDEFGWVGRGTPLRYLLVDSYCPYSAPSATVLVSPATVLLSDYNSHYYKRNSNFGKPAPFKRFLETGQPDQMPSYSSSDDGTISFNPVKRKNRKFITGVFAHNFTSDDESTLYGTIIVPVQYAGSKSL